MVGNFTRRTSLIPPVLLDTSFLISLVDLNRPNHNVAAQYYRWLLQQQSPLYFSAIVAAELAIKQPITDFPLKNFRQIPFNIPHAIEAARIWNLLG
ncbi:MAG: PIN domain-containing protein [Methylobacter sp.]